MPGFWAPAQMTGLADGEVHVWWVELDPFGETAAGVLSAPERERAARIGAAARRRRWSAARAALRVLLGAYLDCDPGAVTLAQAPDGKPELHERADGLRFNLSHAEGHALYAVGRDHELGVDLELGPARERMEAVVRRMLGDGGLARFDGLAPADRERELLAAWVHREAALKCLGSGFAGGAEPDAVAQAIAGLWSSALPPLPGDRPSAAALACTSAPARVLCLTWAGADAAAQ
jgi:4'-phosphopantetheinyl transferase